MTHGVSNGFFLSTLFIGNRIGERSEISNPIIDRSIKDGTYVGEVMNLQHDFGLDGIGAGTLLAIPFVPRRDREHAGLNFLLFQSVAGSQRGYPLHGLSGGVISLLE